MCQKGSEQGKRREKELCQKSRDLEDTCCSLTYTGITAGLQLWVSLLRMMAKSETGSALPNPAELAVQGPRGSTQICFMFCMALVTSKSSTLTFLNSSEMNYSQWRRVEAQNNGDFVSFPAHLSEEREQSLVDHRTETLLLTLLLTLLCDPFANRLTSLHLSFFIGVMSRLVWAASMFVVMGHILQFPEFENDKLGEEQRHFSSEWMQGSEKNTR